MLQLTALICTALFLTGCGEGEGDDRALITTPPEKTGTAEVTTTDLQAIIDSHIDAGAKRIVIPPGRYHLEARRGTHLLFSDLSDIEIIAENVEIVGTSTIRAIRFENCTNLTLRGLTIDYDPLPFTQGEIIAMAPDKSWIDFKIADGYPENRLQPPFQIYNPATGTLRRGDARWSQKIEALGESRYRIRKAERYRFAPDQDTEQIGDIVVGKNFAGRPGSPHAIELRGCKGMRFEDITIYASSSFGFLERHCEATTYLRCVIDRRPPEDDPVPRAMPRMRSLNADAFHSKDATIGPAILSCTARFQGDDAVNINGRYHFVRRTSGNQVHIAIIDRNATIRQGDAVEFLPYSGPRPPDAKVVRRQPDPKHFTADEKNFIRRLRMDQRMKSTLLEGSVQYFILTLDREVSLPPGSAIACSERLGNGFSVKDCDFSETRSRGILIKASNGEIRGNRIHNTRMHAILVSPESWWMEAGMSSNLVIEGNHIQGCLQTPIQIHAHGGNREILPAGALRDISILNNRIEDSAWPLIHVTSTTGLTIDGNILPASGPDPSIPPIVLEQCETQ